MFDCLDCGRSLDVLPPDCGCPCGGLLQVTPTTVQLPTGWRDRPAGVWKYHEFLPAVPETARVTMGEGGTRLLEAPRLAQELGLRRLRLKIEGDNPTGSFKDRGMTAAISIAHAAGAKAFGCASTGNTSASMAAYAARLGKPAIVLLPAGHVAAGKVAQAIVHGAQIMEIPGSFDDAMALIAELAAAGHISLLNSKNPFRLEGQKTLMYEILDAGHVDRVVYPVGNAGNISAGHRAILDYQAARLLADVPRLTGIQAEGAAPVARAIASGDDAVTPVTSPETLASAIRIGRPVSAVKALRAIRDTDGTATAVTDRAILDAQHLIARLEGVFAEPASCATVAGLQRLIDDGAVDGGEDVVCVLTGNGLKDPAAPTQHLPGPLHVDASVAAVLEAMK